VPPSQQQPPPYQRITQHYRDLISRGELKNGDSLPSVRDLSKLWNVAHATASKVMTTLRSEGLVETSTGAGGGTRVSAAGLGRTARDRVTAMRRWGKIYPDGEYARIKTASLMDAPADVAEALGVEPGSPVIQRRRVTYGSDDRPVSASTSWFPGEFVEQAPDLLKAERIKLGTPGYIEQQTGRVLRRGRDQISAGAADEEAATDLGVPAGTPVLVGRNWFRDENGAVIEYGESVGIGGRWQAYEYEVD